MFIQLINLPQNRRYVWLLRVVKAVKQSRESILKEKARRNLSCRALNSKLELGPKPLLSGLQPFSWKNSLCSRLDDHRLVWKELHILFGILHRPLYEIPSGVRRRIRLCRHFDWNPLFLLHLLDLIKPVPVYIPICQITLHSWYKPSSWKARQIALFSSLKITG